MATWAWVIADTTGAHRSDLTRAKNRKLSFKVDAAATASWSTTGDDPGAIATTALASDLMVYRNRELFYRGRVNIPKDKVDETTHGVTWSAIDYRGVLDRRLIWPGMTTSFTGVDQATIAWTLISQTQTRPEGGLGITNGSTPTGVTRDRDYETGKSLGESIDQLSQVIGGFDWEIGADLQFRVWHPQRGSVVPWVADHGGTIADVERDGDSQDFATDLIGYGGEGTTPVVRSVTPPRGPAGRWEATMSWTDVTKQTTLVEHTEAALADMSTLTPSYKLKVKRGAWTPSDAWLGDTVRFICRSGRLDVDTTGRVLQVDIALDEDGGEEVTLTLDRRLPRYEDRLVSMADQIATLSRR